MISYDIDNRELTLKAKVNENGKKWIKYRQKAYEIDNLDEIDESYDFDELDYFDWLDYLKN